MSSFQQKYSLKELNTFGIDVSAETYASFSSEVELEELLSSPQIKKDNLVILGGGSNVLFVNDYDGIVLKNNIKGIREKEQGEDKVLLSCGAGEIWDEVVQYAVNKNYYGIENLSLIPGSVGAAPIQNIGAYGVEVKDVFHSLEGYFISNLEKRVFQLDECKFGYRDSIFKGELKGEFIITKVNLILSKKKQLNISYRSLNNYFVERNIKEPTIHQVREAVIQIRNSKLPEPKHLGNAGSFFKNPKVTHQDLDKLKEKYPAIPSFPFDDIHYKIAAGWLIEKVGLKGERVGNVGTHKDQALVIVNYGGASGKEIIEFAKNIQIKVLTEFGILLEPEVNIINNNYQESL